jgi:predicted XRE-type DNA-binding protein
MQIREFQKPITAKVLNENLAKKFGYKINFEQFTDVQLEDARNKLRTRLSQMELSEAFDSVLESPQYQKTRLMLDCINQEILERDDSGEKAEKDYDGDGEVESGKDEYMGSRDKAIKKAKEEKTDEGYIVNTVRSRAKELSVPETWINKTIAQINLGEGVDREELKAELSLRYDLNETQASWILLEGEESKAETIMATKDMVDRITGWLEDTAAMKAEQLLELLDSIRETQGSDVAQSYQEAVKPALEAIYTALETSRQGLSNALSIVSGGEVSTMGAAPSGALPGAEAGGLPPMPGEEGEMGAEELPTPPAPEVGREKRESVDYSRRLAMLLNSKKK